MSSPQQLHPLSIYRGNHKTTSNNGFINSFYWRIPTKAVVDFTRCFAMMVGAHLSLLQALETAVKQTGNDQLTGVLDDVGACIRSGMSLSASLARHPRIFDPLYVNLTRIGEEAGILPQMLLRLAAYREKSADMRRKLKQAMSYPLVVLSVAIGATTFLLAYIVPTFAEMFASFGAELPRPTRIILDLSHVLTEHFSLIFAAATLTILLAIAGFKYPIVKFWWHKRSLKLPLIGRLFLYNQAAHFCRMLGTLLECGIGLVDALSILCEGIHNDYIRAELRRVRAGVMRGSSLHKPMGQAAFFPEMIVQMIAAGEETAELGQMLIHSADYYESELDLLLDGLSSIIEPLMIVLVGVLLGGILVAMYLPMFDLVNIIQ